MPRRSAWWWLEVGATKEGKEEVIKITRKFKDIGVTDCSLVLENLLIKACQEMYDVENRHESRGAQAREKRENLLNQACQEMYGAENRDENRHES